jgi:hypothetical protein
MNILEYGCFLLAIPQTISACLQIAHYRKLRSEANMAAADKPVLGWPFWSLIVGVTLSVALGFWFILHPIKPSIQTNTVTVEKQVPCPVQPPTRSGNATARGSGNQVVTGSGNSLSQGAPQPSPAKKP